VTVITPPLGTPLIGLFEYREATTVGDDLAARALVLDDGTTRLALVVCDLIAISGSTVAAARERIATRYGIPGDHVLVAATHTHTGPAPVSLLTTPIAPDYLAWLPDRIADSVGIACSRLVPARAAWGAAAVDGVCFNRRFRMRDGTVVFNPPLRSPDIVESVGPVDPTVTALLIEDRGGTPLALWANLALHYVGTDDPLAVSADYFGQCTRAVERVLGPASCCLLANGASGDVNNRDVCAPPGADTGTSQAQRVALSVAAAAIKATVMQRRDEAPTLAAARNTFSVARRPITDGDVALAKRLLSRSPAASFVKDEFSFVVGQPIPEPQRETYAREVLEVSRMPKTIETEIQVLRIGGLALVALPGEIFVSLGQAVKADSPFPLTTVVGLANDYVGYVPTREAFGQGGYETWAARSAWPAPGTGEAMVTASLAHLRALYAETPVSSRPS
jgi:neutral ceramidase